MDIEITDLNSYEIIQILDNYPKGNLKIKYDRIFWESLSTDSTSRRDRNSSPRSESPNQRPQEDNVGQRFERMADTLGRMVC